MDTPKAKDLVMQLLQELGIGVPATLAATQLDLDKDIVGIAACDESGARLAEEMARACGLPVGEMEVAKAAAMARFLPHAAQHAAESDAKKARREALPYG